MAEFLCSNIDFLPIIHFIYMRECVTFDDLLIIINKNHINLSLEEVIRILEDQKMAEIDYEHKKVIKLGLDFSTPRTSAGNKLKNDFLILETQKSLNLKSSHQNQIIINEDGSYVFCGIKCINFERNKDEYERYISDLLACFNSDAVGTWT